MTESHLLSRRAALKFGATVAALPLVHIRTAGAAGKLKVAFGSSLVPGADDALRKLIGQWAAQTKTEVEASFLSYTTNQIVMTVAAEAQARTGHDVVGLAYAGPITYAHLLEPVDDVVRRLQQKYGPTNEIIEYVGKVEGHWAAVPANVLGNVLPCCGRIDVFKQQLGMDLQQTFPAKPEMGPGYDQWTWDAFLVAAERCAKVAMPFGLPISACDDAQAWLGSLFRSYGAELLDAAGNVTVDSDAVRAVLEYLKRLTPYLPDSVYSWDNASNNRALIGGQSALILNPPSAWAQAVKDRPQVGSQCWHFPPPVGPKGRFINYFPQFWGIWRFGTNKSAAKELVEWLSQRERAELICAADYGFDIPPFLSMNDFKVWEEAGPPEGTLFNYPIKPAHHATATLPTYPAPLGLMAPIYGLAVLPNMVARVTRSGRSIEETITWAQRELESLKG